VVIRSLATAEDLPSASFAGQQQSFLNISWLQQRNESVARMIKHVISVTKKGKRKIGICGDVPSTYPEFAEFWSIVE
jgi:phosphoenolpyruvate synthase/pyruvate phosphate dikinase